LRLLAPGVLARILTYERLDALIRGGELPPFILVQPDASLRRPRLYRTLSRSVQAKGSMYVDSPRTGRYTEYVFRDVVDYVDRSYRTLAGREGRALAGASMGGYGALRGGILHPERFAAVAALSPVVGFLALQELTLVVPIARRLFGSRLAAALGRRTLADVLETCAWVFGPDRRQWADADLGALAASAPGALRGVRVRIDCEAEDEYGLAGPCRRLSEGLTRLGVAHELDIYSDSLAEAYSPHTLGIAGRILPALRFCLDRLRPPSATTDAPPPAGLPPG
jgi:pimeloyl-ACP methyl ester carboxylesterase